MSRPLRLEFSGAVYHITARANARQQLFTNIADGNQFLNFLAREIQQHRWICHAYCLLEDHYHLVLETPEPNLGRGMGRLNMAYSQWFGRQYDQRGHLFYGRYKSIILQKERHLLEVCRHVVLKPVRLQAVNRVDHWRWSSYQGFDSEQPAWLHREWLRNQIGSGKAWHEYVEKGLGAPSPWENLRAGHYLGDETFLEDIAERIRGLPLDQVAAKVADPTRPTPDKVMQSVAHASGTLMEVLLDRKADPAAFKATVYLLRRASNLPLKEVATMAGVSQGRISQIQRSIENQGGIGSAFPWGSGLTYLL
ncbi:MAG: hypothetical protein CMM52_04725 [Rhodospirillaceae bacterium]|nr:hypothetical protein [Rhodospirillaceae bacterium]|tara:strand:- start:14076 stop:14999 length:924 start_codon:yes stop_codon:yes gene_type:complete